MNIIDDNELKTIQLDILADVDAFCRLNGIEYSLAFGTLLGAIRHKGYIPWDDDIDIMIPRKDYEKFIKTYFSSRYQVICHENCVDYLIPFAKVHDPRTVMEELSDTRASFGVYIDVFPVDNFPSDEGELKSFIRKKKVLNLICDINTTAYRKGRQWYKNALLAMGKLLLCICRKASITSQLEQLSQKYSGTDTGFSGVIAPTDNKLKWRMDSNVFKEYISVTFEGLKLRAVRNYDKYLSCTYGDYMQLPPEDQRISHHHHIVYYK